MIFQNCKSFNVLLELGATLLFQNCMFRFDDNIVQRINGQKITNNNFASTILDSVTSRQKIMKKFDDTYRYHFSDLIIP